MKKAILLLIIIAGLTDGCKKYDEGPWLSLRSAKNRLYGDYTLTKYTVDGVDSLQQMKDGFGLNFHFYYEKNNDNDDLLIDGGTHFGNYYQDFVSHYKFIDNKKGINIYYGTIIFTGYNGNGFQNLDFTILKLNNNEVHLKTTYADKEYYFELN